MSDSSVATALRSSVRLVVVEAPAGCGKTTQGASFAKDIWPTLPRGRVLILAHTHAACDVFAMRTRGCGHRVEICTIDSLICQISSAYHQALGLPADTAAWARTQPDGYQTLAAKVSLLLKAAPMISRSLASRYPVVIFDEHQDASADQHTIALACLQGGARVRIFGDPMQRIYGSSKKAQVAEDLHRWRSVNEVAEVSDKLDTPHRWKDAPELGTWILAARETLKGGGKIDLRGGLPTGLSVIAAENDSSQPQGYTVAHPHNVPIYKVINEKKKLLVLAAHNSTVDALHAFFGRKLVIWEGHGRESLSTLVEAVHLHDGNAAKVTAAAIDFLGSVSTGFSRSAFGDRLLSEVTGGCSKRCTGKPATLQVLGRIILSEPNHKGVAKFFLRLNELRDTDEVFSVVKLNYRSEFWDAVRLAHFDDVKEGYAEIARRRTARRPLPPHKAISTIHKAKGLECEDALLIPCDQKHFPDTPAGRCRLYVALSRAMRTLTIVVSKKNPSPLLVV